MSISRLLWLAVPLLGLGELGAHSYFSNRPPTLDEWRSVRNELARLRKNRELVVIAPSWAEPLARHAFGDELLPLAQVARPDSSGFSRAIEVSTLGAESAELASWRTLTTIEQGRFSLRVRENPNFSPTRFDFVEAVARGEAQISVRLRGADEPCRFSERARAASGGLHGHVAYPRARFRCGKGDEVFVGVTVIDDQQYRPRRCILARAPASGSLRIRFPAVPLASSLRGYAGLSYFIHRDGSTRPVTLRVKLGGREIGDYVHRDETGWHPFEFGSEPSAAADVEFEVESAAPGRDFCFFADSR